MISRKVTCNVGSKEHAQFYTALKSNPQRVGADIETYALYITKVPTRGELRDALEHIRLMPNLKNFIYKVKEGVEESGCEAQSPEAKYPGEYGRDANSAPPGFWRQPVRDLHEVNDMILKSEPLRKADLKSFYWLAGDEYDNPETDFLAEGVLAYLHKYHPRLESVGLSSLEEKLPDKWVKCEVDPQRCCSNLRDIGGTMETVNRILPGRALVKSVSIFHVTKTNQLRADLLYAWRNIESVRLFGAFHTHGAPKLETEAVEYILEGCPNLKTLEFRTSCSLKGLEAFIKKPPRTKLQELTLHIAPLQRQLIENRDDLDKLKQFIQTNALHRVIDSGWAKKVAIVWPGWTEEEVLLALPIYKGTGRERLEARIDDGVFSMIRAFCYTVALEQKANGQPTGQRSKSYPTIELRELDASWTTPF